MLNQNKKSIVFTIIGIILSAVIILALSAKTEYTLKGKMEVTKTRVETMNSFIKDVEDDLERGLYITSFNSLLAIEGYISSNGTYLGDADKTFQELLLNGTLNESDSDIMKNNTFTDWTKSVQKEAEKIGIDIGFSFGNLSMIHEEPWNIKIALDVKINAEDKKKTSSWGVSRKVSTSIDITGFEDPVYTIETFGRVVNSINKTPFTGFSNINNLINHINSSYYKTSSSAPDFLMRLEGNFSPSQYGIESIVNLNRLSAQNLQTYLRSNVDYIYFSDISHSNCIAEETQDTDFDWLRMDNGIEPLNHLNDYGLNCEE